MLETLVQTEISLLLRHELLLPYYCTTEIFHLAPPLLTYLVFSETSQQLLDGSPQNLTHKVMSPTGLNVMTLNDQLFI